MPRRATYQAAKLVSELLEEHFAKLAADTAHNTVASIPLPAAAQIETILDTAFWASLRREEGKITKISLAYHPPENAHRPLLFAQKLPLTPHVLTKLAPGVERPGIHVGVWHQDGELYIWGTTREIKHLCFVVDVSEPGLLVVKHRRIRGFGKFVNVAVLKGDQVKMVDEEGSLYSDCPTFLSSLLGFATPDTWNGSVNIMVQLAVSMRAHGRGGSLLVVPAQTDRWRQSIIHPIQYAVSPSFNGMSELMKQDMKQKNFSVWQGAMQREIDSLAGLTAIDGATIISDQYHLLAFGAKIARSHEGNGAVDKILMTEPILGESSTVVQPTQSGGTRHISAAQFVHDQHDAIALVASQDGRFTVFSWSLCADAVRAHRIDALLL